ncbi:MAG: alkaline phosphatase family protein [Betaproteobacteria bacterium]|nr:alkaline phosphatase family protein [Betaproteobacteria bacterium]
MKNKWFQLGVITAVLAGMAPMAHALQPGGHAVGHVLMISVDGLHAQDLRLFIRAHPRSALATLARDGVVYGGAHTVAPADSFPGLLALVTGGTPAVTGVYYDVTYDRRLSPPGSRCRRVGTPVVFDETVDQPGAAPGAPTIDPARLPRDPRRGCAPVYPHDYLRVNTLFEVVRAAGGYTAWIDKHPVYEIVDGPSGKGVNDLYTPEIGANFAGPVGQGRGAIMASLSHTERYDDGKVDALLHEIGGFRHDGRVPAPVPTLFGLNLQAANVGEKLGGYQDAAGHPSPTLEAALVHCDRQIGRIVAALRARRLLGSTLVIVTAKHGNGPIDPHAVRHVDRRLLERVVARAAQGEVAQITADQVALIWLRDAAKVKAVVAALRAHRKALGVRRVLFGRGLLRRLGLRRSDSRAPDMIVIPRDGVIYARAGDPKKAEHGGFSADDTSVALLVSNPHLARRDVEVRERVSTTQVAPTILASLGLSTHLLRAVALQGTRVLPGEPWADLAGVRLAADRPAARNP